MNRRNFIERSAFLVAGLFSLPAISKPVHSAGEKRNTDRKEFVFAAICSTRRFDELKEMLRPSSGIRLVRYSPARAIRRKVSAAWIERDYRHRQRHIIRLLTVGIPVLAEAPYNEGISAFDTLQKTVSAVSVPAGIAYYHRFLPACLSARELLLSDRIGKIVSIQLQINQAENDPLLPANSFRPEASILILANLMQWLLSQPLLAIRVSRKETEVPASAISSSIILGAMEDLPVRIATIPNFYNKNGAWSILFTGEKGQIRLGANNLLEIFDESGKWQNLSKEDPNKASLSVRMCFEDFALAVKEKKPPEGKTTDMLSDSLLYSGILQSLQSGKGELLIELPFGKAVRL